MTDPTNSLRQMLQRIEFYRKGDLSLGALIGDLEFLSDSIAGPEPAGGAL